MAEPVVETYALKVHRRVVERPQGRRVEWRLTLQRGRDKAVETDWKPRARFFQDYLLHQSGLWAEWVLSGIGRPTL